MARKSRSTGVGRGNGLGSARSQYKSGMPSGNPQGRPKKVKPKVPTTFQEAFAMELVQPIDITEGGVDKTIPCYQALIKDLFASLPRASPSVKLKMLLACIEIAPQLVEPKSLEPSSEAIEAFVTRLRQEHERRESARTYHSSGVPAPGA